MGISFRIQDAAEGAELAVATRNAFAAWITSKADELAADPLQALPAERIKELRAQGAAAFTGFACPEAPPFDPASVPVAPDEFSWEREARIRRAQRRHLVAHGVVHYTDVPKDAASRLCAQMVLCATSISMEVDDIREKSYVLEGAASALNRAMHEQALKWTPELSRNFIVGLYGPYCFHGTLESEALAAYCLRHTSNAGSTFLNSVRGWGLDAAEQGFKAARETLNSTQPQPLAYTQLVLPYVDVDGPWVCGYLTPLDFSRGRFTRKRLGVYLAESKAFCDLEVLQIVERVKSACADSGTFVVYPNDITWGKVYVEGHCRGDLGSCMSHDTSDYNTWDGIHPVDVYSSAAFGAGDNGLALIVSVGADGVPTGRGIWNCERGSIVRWYGDHKAKRCLNNLGVDTSDCGALGGAWLALVEKGGRFIHPYVDGNYDRGDIQGQRVYIDESGVCLQDTAGSSYTFDPDVQECVYSGDMYPESEMRYQPESETWISDRAVESGDACPCPAIGEFGLSTSTIHLKVDGGIHAIEISDYALHSGLYVQATGMVQRYTSMFGAPRTARAVYRIINESIWDSVPC